MPTIGEQFRITRESQGVTQSALASVAGTDQSTISDIEHDKTPFEKSLFVRVAAGLGCELRLVRTKAADAEPEGD